MVRLVLLAGWGRHCGLVIWFRVVSMSPADAAAQVLFRNALRAASAAVHRPRGPISVLLTAPHRATPHHAVQVLCGAAAGLEYMHACGVIHHDFTSYNLLLDERNGRWTTKVGRNPAWDPCGSRGALLVFEGSSRMQQTTSCWTSAPGPRWDCTVTGQQPEQPCHDE